MNAKKIIALALMVILAFSCTACTTIELVIPVGNIPTASTNTDTTPTPDSGSNTTPVEATAAPVQEATTAAPTQETTASASAQEATTSASTQTPEWTTAQIVDYFNKSANKVKTDATKVVKNYEDRTVGEVVVPQILQSALKGLMETSMKDDTDPITYGTKEEIRENFLVPEQDYVSRLTVDSVESAEISDKGNEYVIRIELKDETNPTAGAGVGALFDVIEAKEIAESGIVEDFTTEYYDCVVVATIDKATGNMTQANYTTPLILNVSINMFGTHSGNVNLTFEKDYTITY